MELPLFPLHTVLCPGVALPLKIFEERYRLMTKRCLELDEPFGIVLIRDGRYDLLVVGTRRFRIEHVAIGREPYLVGDVTELDEPLGDGERAERLTGDLTQRFVRYLNLLQPVEGEDAADVDVQVEVDVDDDDPAEGELVASRSADRGDGPAEEVRVTIPDDPTVLSYLLSGIIQVDQPRRQELLEAATTVDRIDALIRLVDREVTLLERRLRIYNADPRLSAIRRN